MSEPLRTALAELERLREGLIQESASLAAEQEIRGAQARYRRQLDGVLEVMRKLPPEEKKQLGQAANQLKGELERIAADRLAGLAKEARSADLGRAIDVTLP